MSQDPTRSVTQEQMQALKETFLRADKDGDGFISVHELGSVMRSLGQNPTSPELTGMISAVDTDNDGEISFAEFLTLVAETHRDTDPDDQLRELFTKVDQDGDGYLSTRELAQALARHGERLTEAEVAERLRREDRDGDGRIDYAEFVAVMMR